MPADGTPMTDAATTLAQKITALIDRGNLETSGQEHVDAVKAVVLLEAAADMLLELAEERDRHASRLAAVTGWLDKHERSVFRRGLWDAIAEADAARNATQEKPR